MSLASRAGRAILVATAAAALSAPAFAGGRIDATPAAFDGTDRIIVRLRDPAAADPDARIAEVAGRVGERVRRLRAMSGGGHVLALPVRVSLGEARAVARRLANDAAVEYAEPDVRLFPQRVPNDSYYAQQWDFFEPAGGINLPAAWDVTTGAANIVIAVVDTGIVNHADLAGRLVAGYDFISSTTVSNDGDGRDADASDPGDYGCDGSPSSWHGTHVAGTIGAATNNGVGVAGINWVSKIQPVRVLGRCGGYSSDIVDGMRWAAGIAVAGAPANPTPARVLNLSLGGDGACGTTFQNAVNDIVARGTVVVVAAGNANTDVANFTPASCAGVVAVGATVRNGGRASYSNYGAGVAISAPGGGNDAGILSTINAGSTTPTSDAYAYYMGTSMATPHVSGVVSLMLSLDPSLTPAQVLTKLKATARPFPSGTGADCNTSLCGAGIVDATAALGGSTSPPVVPPVTGRVNLALASNGAQLSASSTYSAAYAPSGANDGDRRGAAWGAGGGWNDATAFASPDWLQVDFGTTRSVAEIDVFTVQDTYWSPAEPTEAMTFTQYGITDFEVQYWTGSAWQAVPGGSVTGNNKVWRKFTFAAVSTSRIRVLVLGALQGYSRITEIEAYPNALTNVALQSNGGVAVASSVYSSAYAAAGANDGERRGLNWGAGGGWNDATYFSGPDTLQVNFNGTKSLTEIDVFTVQDTYWSPADPSESMTFSQYGITDFEVQYWTGSAWATVPGASVAGNDKVWRKFSFAALATNSIRVVVSGSLAGYSRITEIEAYAAP
jgi:serine protease